MTASEDLTWQHTTHWPVEGRGFSPHLLARPFDRLPARAETTVPANVWQLSRQPAGLSLRFWSDAPVLFARWEFDGAMLFDQTDSALRCGGLDLYGRDPDGIWRFTGFGRPALTGASEARLTAEPLAPGRREYRLYLPLTMPVTRLELGVPAGSMCEPAATDARKPLVCWGTSIMHGARASRPGMSWLAIAARRLDHPLINLGFSGNGRMDPEVAAFVAEIDAAAYVVDCLPNMSPEQITERVPALVRIVQERRPTVPILFIGDRLFGDAAFLPEREESFRRKNAALAQAVAGLRGPRLLPGRDFFGVDGSVDGSHPNDLGAQRMAETLEPVLRQLIGPAAAAKPVPP